MDSKITFPFSLDEPTDIDTVIQECFSEVDNALAQMQRDQAEIDTLKAETRLLNEQTRAIHAELNR